MIIFPTSAYRMIVMLTVAILALVCVDIYSLISQNYTSSQDHEAYVAHLELMKQQYLEAIREIKMAEIKRVKGD